MARGTTALSHPAASPIYPKRPVSDPKSGDAAPNRRLKRSRHGPPPLYAEYSEDEDAAETTPSKRRRKPRMTATNRVIKSPRSVTETHHTASSPDRVAQTKIKKTIHKQSPADVKIEDQEFLVESISSGLHHKATDPRTLTTGIGRNPPAPSRSIIAKPETGSTIGENEAATHNEILHGAAAKPKRRRKTKEEKEAEAMPLAARTIGSRLFIGAHVSAAGGVHHSVTNALHIGGNAFALFQKSQRKWDNPAINPEHADQFKSLCASHNYSAASHVVPHGSYLVNLAQPDIQKAEQAYNSFLDDIQRSESLGIKLYNFHPGNTNGEPRDEAIARIARRLNAAHKATKTVVTLLENMAASPSGNTVGGSFQDLRGVIDLIDDKSRVGVCLDTCHAFAAGYDLRSPEAFAETMSTFDAVIGFRYLRAVHLNDSKAPFASHRDLHQNIGLGFLGLRAFHNLVNDPRFAGLPLILETPIDQKDDEGKIVEDKAVWAGEIKLLESLVDMDANGDKFKAIEAQLAAKGAAERDKYQTQFEKKLDKMTKKVKSKAPDRRGRRESTDDSEKSN